MNGWLLLRIAGIVVGIATLLRVATNEGMVTYDPLFLSWVDWLSDIVELGFLTKLIGPFLHWGIEQVRSFGISVPDLQDEWRPAWVLSMLMFGSMSRHSRRWGGLLVAPVGALAIAVWSGLTGSLAPAALAAAVGSVLAIAFAPIAFVAVGGAVAIAFAVLAITFAPIAFVAVGVAVAGLLFLLGGTVESWSAGLRGLLANPSFNIGIDILGVMLGALGLASLFANPPIW